MKRKIRKIRKVVSIAASEERRFSEQAGRSQRALNQQLERLKELHAYRRGYNNKAPVSGGMNSAHWKDYQTFIDRLDQATRTQQQVIRECEQNLEMHRRRWMVKRQKLESLERVLDKCHRREAVHANRLEQKQLDDLPGRQVSIVKSGDA
ncbi:MAG TPA: flagellar export protein FliJ [Woeseiaceae bacterium]|nr:flagellar export protein FliJ [Woeseiaceae bacterium]